MNPIGLDTAHGGKLFAIFYLLGFLTILTLFFLAGLKQKYPFRTLWIVAVTMVLFFILGEKFFAINPSEWKEMVLNPAAISQGSKTILGGLVGLIAASILVTRLLKLDAGITDLAAPGLPLAIAVSRLGCLFAGCCYGKPSDLPWAVCYPAGHRAYDHHLASGFIGPDEFLSLPVHPVQVYDILCCLIIALLIWKYSGFLKAGGNKILLAVMLYGLARFILEFVRDPESEFYATTVVFGLKIIQWWLAACILITSSIIILREKSQRQAMIRTRQQSENLTVSHFLSLALLVLYFALFRLLDPLERTIIGFLIIPTLLIILWDLSGKMLLPGLRPATLALLLICFLLLGQTYIPADDDHSTRYFEIGAGNLFSKYYTETAEKIWCPASDGYTDCQGIYHPPEPAHYGLGNMTERTHSSSLYGMNASYHTINNQYEHLAFGLNGMWGYEKESWNMCYYDSVTLTYYSVPHEDRKPQYDLNPYVSYDRKYIGADLGFHIGNFRVYSPNNKPTLEDPSNTIPTMHFYPQLGFRLGPRKILYLDAGFCNAFPTCFPLNQYSLGLASGLGRINGVKLGAGWSSGGFYSCGTIVIKNRVALDLYFSDNIWSDYTYEDRMSFSFALRYRFKVKSRSYLSE